MPLLEPGLTHATRAVVDRDMSPPHLAPLIVLATPEMIWLMEETCTGLVQSALDDADQTTVGTHVDVSHEAVAGGGETVEVEAILTAVDGPRLTFRVEARVGSRMIGRGTHRRHIVDRGRFAHGVPGLRPEAEGDQAS